MLVGRSLSWSLPDFIGTWRVEVAATLRVSSFI